MALEHTFEGWLTGDELLTHVFSFTLQFFFVIHTFRTHFRGFCSLQCWRIGGGVSRVISPAPTILSSYSTIECLPMHNRISFVFPCVCGSIQALQSIAYLILIIHTHTFIFNIHYLLIICETLLTSKHLNPKFCGVFFSVKLSLSPSNLGYSTYDWSLALSVWGTNINSHISFIFR